MIAELTITIRDYAGLQGSIQVSHDPNGTARPGYQYLIERIETEPTRSLWMLDTGHDLHTGAGDPSHVKAMGALLAFLESDAEKYTLAKYAGDTSEEAVKKRTGDGYCFNERTAEWAYGLADEIAMARLEIEGSDA